MSVIHFHNKMYDPLENGRKFHKGGGESSGSSTTTIYTPTATPAPSTAEAIQAWVSSMPTVFAEQQRQAPLEAQQQLQLLQQYGLPLASAAQSIDAALYPKTQALQENMADQATTGMNATSMPDWMKDSYRSDYNANLGTNAGSPIGAEYVSRNMQKQLFEQQKYYRDLGLSLSGRQPLVNNQQGTPQTTNYASTFTPGSVMNYVQQGYGSYSQAARPIATTNSQQKSNTANSYLWGLI